MAESNKNKFSYNINSLLEIYKKNELANLNNLKDHNSCGIYVSFKLNIMFLKIYEEELEKYGGSVFQKEEIEAINKQKEIQQNS